MSEEMIARALAKACGHDPDAILNGVPEWVSRQVEARAVLSAYNPNERLREALEVFACIGDKFTIDWSDADVIELSHGFRVLDKIPVSAFRKARSALSPLPQGDT